MNRPKPGCSLLLVVLLIVAAQGQTREPDVFAEVPARLRARLVERLNMLLEYQRTQQWKKLYDLLYKPTVSKEKYVEQNIRFTREFGGDVLLDFEPQSVTLLYPESGWFFIKGCVTQRKKDGRVVTLEADTEARLENGEWYISAVAPTIPIDGEPKPCSASQQNRLPAAPSSPRCPAAGGKKNRDGRQR